ncbi:hypothetical protein AC579_5372 [Pseudocercospora musae]|uniref:Uncharacterized protein n=1 Tax=Pseudocercospora musae TaxID=113226 RepID=A0A139H3V1_9PEZI|nr:hypothetical protein AC579_5372 [Pseudocercospora musae]
MEFPAEAGFWLSRLSFLAPATAVAKIDAIDDVVRVRAYVQAARAARLDDEDSHGPENGVLLITEGIGGASIRATDVMGGHRSTNPGTCDPDTLFNVSSPIPGSTVPAASSNIRKPAATTTALPSIDDQAK